MRAGPLLRIVVSDTGPGLQNGPQASRLAVASSDDGEPVSTGVGLANIRDRLAQAYGEEHRFEIQDASDGGFEVAIEIPFETRGASVEASPAPVPALRIAAAG